MMLTQTHLQNGYFIVICLFIHGIEANVNTVKS